MNSITVELFLNSLYNQIMPVISLTVFQIIIATRTSYAAPSHEHGTSTAILLTVTVSHPAKRLCCLVLVMLIITCHDDLSKQGIDLNYFGL